MTDPIELDIDDGSRHLVDPPIVDHLFLDQTRGVYVVTFIPQDDVSPNDKEVVEIGSVTEDGRRIAVRLKKLSELVGGEIARLYHAGGGDFGFKLDHEKSLNLSDIQHPWLDAYIHLQDLGMIAQIAFRDAQLKAGAA